MTFTAVAKRKEMCQYEDSIHSLDLDNLWDIRRIHSGEYHMPNTNVSERTDQ